MFIVEGLDYAGKTTALEITRQQVIAQRWCRWCGPCLKHTIDQVQTWGRLPDDFDYCRSYILSAHGAQLCDRFVLSELVYGNLFRSGPNPKFNSHARRRVQRELNITGSVTALVTADWLTTQRRARARCKSDYDKAMRLMGTYITGTQLFGEALADRALGTRGGEFLGVLDTSDSRVAAQPDAVPNAIAWMLERWRACLERSREVQRICPKSWGYLWPRVLLVGENINHPNVDRPFAGDAGASQTLTDLLDGADVGERDIYLWNAYNYDRSPLLTAEGVALLRPRIVVALGRQAALYLKGVGIAHLEFPHPQWIGRFHRKEIDTWAMKLRAILAPYL